MPVEQSSSLRTKRKYHEEKECHQNAEGKGKTNRPELLHPFSTDTSSHSKIDFIKLLPAEIRELILLYLDTRTLTAACCVSKTWYKLISPCCRVWRQACQSLDLVITDEDKSDENYWRTLFLKMYKRRYQMLINVPQSFVCYTYTSRVPLTAIYYYDGKVATASACTKKIKIWERATFKCLLTVKCNSWITSVKFDDFIIMVATDHAGIQCYDVKLGHLLRRYLSEIHFVSCFDYSLKVDLVVGGFHDTSIRIWRMATAKTIIALYGHPTTVIKVMLKPQFEFCQKQHTLLLSMDAKVIFVRLLSFVYKPDPRAIHLKVVTWYKIFFEYRPCVPRHLAPKVQHCVRIIAQCSSRLLFLSHKCISAETCKGFLASVFKFDGEFLYFAFQGDGVSQCKWDLKERCIISHTDKQPGKISALLSSGRLYMTYIVLWRNEQLFLHIVDKNRKKTISCIRLPMNGPEKPGHPHLHISRLCHGEESWLDGFDGKNDQGAIVVAAPEPTNLFIIEWIPRET